MLIVALAMFAAVLPTVGISQCASICGPNLICNPDFEIVTSVCTGIQNGQLYTDQTPIECWYGDAGVNSPQSGITPDNYNSTCRGNSTRNCGSGVGSLGFFTYTGNNNVREFVQSPLLAPLEAGREYCFSTQVLLGGGSFKPNDGLGIWFTNQMVDITTMNGGNSFLGQGSLVNATPYWMLPSGDLISTCVTRSGTFCAQGGETWIVIGNFRDDANTSVQTGTGPNLGYLIIDNVSLTKVCPPTPPLLLQADQLSIPCGGSTHLTASGGGGTYTWIPNIGTGAGPHTVSPLVTTTYEVVSQIQGNCGTYNDTARVTITVGPCGPTVSATGGAVCPGGCSQVSASATGGSGGPPYTYTWSGGLPNGPGPHPVCPPATTVYTVTATDASGDTGTSTVTVTIHPQPTVSTSTSGASCFGGNGGTATATPAVGLAPYTYSWNTTPPQTGPTATALPAGTYTVTVTDANGCTATATATVGEPAELLPTTSATPANCGVADGTATVTPVGGTPPYTYSWNTVPPQTTQTATNLPGGTYDVTVTDANGCGRTVSVTVPQSGAAQLSVTHTDVSCNGANDGTASVTATGGNPPYTYSWNTVPPQATPAATGLPPGTWTVTVTDSDGCAATAQVVVTEPAALVVDISTVPARCGEANGSANAIVSGGSPPYTYAWDITPPRTTPMVGGVFGGSYAITVIDSRGCVISDTVVVANIGLPIQGQSIDKVSFPNVITPNGDGVNDFFSPFFADAPGFDLTAGASTYGLSVFNRWGQLIFESDSPNRTWDGRTVAGERVSDGVYFYIVRLKLICGEDTTGERVGTVQVLH